MVQLVKLGAVKRTSFLSIHSILFIHYNNANTNQSLIKLIRKDLSFIYAEVQVRTLSNSWLLQSASMAFPTQAM